MPDIDSFFTFLLYGIFKMGNMFMSNVQKGLRVQ